MLSSHFNFRISMIIIAQRYKVSSPAGSISGSEYEDYFCLDAVTGSEALVRLPRSVPDKKKQREADELIRKQWRILDRCRHRNIVRALGSGDWNGRPFLATERLKGTSLDGLQPAGAGRLEAADVRMRMAWIAQAAEALAAVHAAGFAHLAIGPEAFSVETDGRVVLSNFRKAVSRPDEGWDILAFGAMAHELLNESCPPEANEILAACRSNDPRARPSASALAEVLNRCAELVRRKFDVRDRAMTDLKQNRRVDALARWEELSELDPSDREPFEQANSILLPLFADAVSRYDFSQATELEGRVDLGMATPEQRETHRRLWAALNEAQTKDRLIDRHIRMARVYHAEGRLDEERTQLNRALSIDPNHPSLRDIAPAAAAKDPGKPSLPEPAPAPKASRSPVSAAASAPVAVLDPVHTETPPSAPKPVPIPVREEIPEPKFAAAKPARRIPVAALIGIGAALLILAGLAYWWTEREAAVAAIAHKDYTRISYNDPVLANCMGVAICLERKKQSEVLTSVVNWDAQVYNSPLLGACMNYPPCVKAEAEATAIQKPNFKKVSRTDTRRAHCRGWKPCLEVFPAPPPRHDLIETETEPAPAAAIFEPRVHKQPAGRDQSPAPLGNERLYRTKD